MPESLPTAEVENAIRELDGWTFDDDALHKEIRFGGFPEALSFLVRLGLAAEHANHHPDVRNVYDRVWLTLSSHDAGGVTERDFALAREVDEILARR